MKVNKSQVSSVQSTPKLRKKSVVSIDHLKLRCSELCSSITPASSSKEWIDGIVGAKSSERWKKLALKPSLN